MKLFLAAASAFLAIHPAGAAFAQDSGQTRLDGDRQISLGLGIPDSLDFHGYAGLAVGAFPDYEGSDDIAAMALPLADIRQPGFLFLKGASVNPNDGLVSVGWEALNLGISKGSIQKLRMSAGPLVHYSGGRDEDDSDTLRGLGDIDDSVGLGGFIAASGGPWSVDLSVVPQETGDGGGGLLISGGVKHSAQVNDKLAISTGISTSWGDDDYMQGYYGVTSSQSARSGLAGFDADAGVKDVGVQIGATYELSRRWVIEGQAGYQRLLNDAGDSPIVDASGSRDQFRALLGVAYQF
ncbi:MAG: MipA/OmpV family protein [Alphaproteobacteria bacterium]|nr:MipA/OmpV family protein [Alphaproteobacteria bacterium]